MDENSWSEKAIREFFAARHCPTRDQCDQLALSISGARTIRPVDVPGSLSYTVIGMLPANSQRHAEAEIISFREPGSTLDARIISLARKIHGGLIPHAISQGVMPGSDPLLHVYTMPLLPGVACLDVLSYQAQLNTTETTKTMHFITHLARYLQSPLSSLSRPIAEFYQPRYFARCYSHVQSVEPEVRSRNERSILRRLAALKRLPAPPISTASILRLEAKLPQFFDSAYPQVLTHGDLSKTNVLVNSETYEITGVVDWSLATVQPFGMELDSLFLMTGCMDTRGWHSYECQSQLWEAFWVAFWEETEIEDRHRKSFRDQAETAAQIGALLHYAFVRNVDGSPSEVPTESETMLSMAKAWLGNH